MVFHHVARAVVPAAQVGLELGGGCLQVARHGGHQVGELTHAGLQVEDGQLSAPSHHFRIQAAEHVALGLLAQLGAQLVGAGLAHQLVAGAVVSGLLGCWLALFRYGFCSCLRFIHACRC